ncbi:MAG TPA: recombinase family protein [Bacteroidia bacterium]
MKFISYYRVSTQRQHVSHLGLDAQKLSVENYIASIGGEIIKEYTEVESAGNKDRISIGNHLAIDNLLSSRPILLKAVQQAIELNAIIVVKEASRLSRFSLLIDYMLSCNIQFVCADSPKDTPFIIKLKTSLNEEELLKVSTRTTLALQALKARGYKYKPKQNYFTPEVIEKATQRRIEIARQNPNNKRAMGYIKQLRENSGLTYQAIANKLNNEGFKSSRGLNFSAKTVQLLYVRASYPTNKV